MQQVYYYCCVLKLIISTYILTSIFIHQTPPLKLIISNYILTSIFIHQTPPSAVGSLMRLTDVVCHEMGLPMKVKVTTIADWFLFLKTDLTSPSASDLY